MFNQHADKIVEGARAFQLLIENHSDAEPGEKYAGGRDNACTTFITPIDREQIHGLINTWTTSPT